MQYPSKRFFRRRALSVALAAGAVMATAGMAPAVQAATYPDRPITLIAPFGAGGGVDNIARRLAQELSGELGQPVVVENRPGAGSLVGVNAAIRSAADGYTVLIADPAYIINSLLTDPAPYDYRKDLKPVSMISRAPYILVASDAMPGTVEDIVAEAGKRENGLTFASAGVGTAAHMTGELFRMRTGAKLLHVPYRSGNPAMTDLSAGQVDIVFTTIASAAPYLKQGRAKPIATTGKERSFEHPDLPTLDEKLKDFEVYFWTSLFVPANTPQEIVDKLEQAAHKVLKHDVMLTTLKEGGNSPMPMSAEDTKAFIEKEATMWKDVIRKADIKIQ